MAATITLPLSRRLPRYLGAAAAAGITLRIVHITLMDEWDDTLYQSKKSVKKALGLVKPIPVDKRPTVVVLGTGWGALSFIRHLDHDAVNVKVISPRSFFFYTPLLAGTATGTVSHSSIVEPIRWYCDNNTASSTSSTSGSNVASTTGHQGGGVQYIQAECLSVDVNSRTIRCSSALGGNNSPTSTTTSTSSPTINSTSTSKASALPETFDLRYDHLVVAVGAEAATFNIPGVRDHALFMKEVSDSIRVQNRILSNLEKANTLLSAYELTHHPVDSDKSTTTSSTATTTTTSADAGAIPAAVAAEVDRLLHWVVVGAGPTGVELTAEITDLIQQDIARYFPRLQGRCRVTLLEATDKVLAMFDRSTAAYACNSLTSRGAVISTGSIVTRIGPDSIFIKQPQTPSATASTNNTSTSSSPKSSLSSLPAHLVITPPSTSSEPMELRTGMVVWAGGIAPRPLVRDIAAALPGSKEHQTSRWGLCVDGNLRVKGAEPTPTAATTVTSAPDNTKAATSTGTLWALGDCAVVAGCAPTAQAANQQGMYLGRLFRDHITPLEGRGVKAASTSDATATSTSTTTTSATTIAKDALATVPAFEYSNRGSLAYVGGSRGVADLKSVIWSNYSALLSGSRDSSPTKTAAGTAGTNTNSATATTPDDAVHLTGATGFAVWRVIYFSRLLSLRNVAQVLFDWAKTATFGRDISTLYAPGEFERRNDANSTSGASATATSGKNTCSTCGGVKK